jgi:hypothetical protein
MQNRYVGDVGDFGKYGLLRVLSGLNDEPRLKLGVVWYLFPDESHNADGKYVGYLQRNDGQFRDCDSVLYDGLRSLLFNDAGLIQASRNVGSIETAGLLPADTAYYSRPLSYERELSLPSRLSRREEWILEALSRTASEEIVFLDPDNGIECKTTSPTKNKGPKYVFWKDIDAFVTRGQSIVVYHHLNRSGSHMSQVEIMRQRMNDRFGNGYRTSAVIYKRGSGRAYFIIGAPAHRELLIQRLQQMSAGSWNRHFDFSHL